MKVSVVIPVYNVKPYLKRCVNSVLRQTHRDLEVIIVDDGSFDGSSELCDQFASTDKRIIVIHQENQGLSGARNAGIQKATGEYIMFLDSDDAWIQDNGLEILLKDDKLAYDLIVFRNVDFWGGERLTHTPKYQAEYLNELPDAQSVFSYLVRHQYLRISACFVIVRREILSFNNILFPHGIISEDLTWSLHLWQYVRSVKIANLEFYGYYHRRDSITTTSANTLFAYHCYDQIFTYWNEQCNLGCFNAAVIRVFLSDMWVSRGYNYQYLQASEKPEALLVLKRHTNLLKYAETRKSKRTATLVSFFGVRSTVFVLGLYWRLRLIIKGHVI